MDSFIGKFNMISSENFDEYMKKVGVGLMLRTLANSAKPTVEITKTPDGKYSIKTMTTFKTTDIAFKLNEEVDETTGDGRNVKTTFVMDGPKLIQKQKATKSGEKDSQIVRYIEGENMVTLVSCEDVTSKRVYKRE